MNNYSYRKSYFSFILSGSKSGTWKKQSLKMVKNQCENDGFTAPFCCQNNDKGSEQKVEVMFKLYVNLGVNKSSSFLSHFCVNLREMI